MEKAQNKTNMTNDRTYIDCFAMIGKKGPKDVEAQYETEVLLEEMEWCGIHGALIAHSTAKEYDPVYGNRMLAWDLANPDFVSLANSFGIAAARVTQPAELTEAIVEAFGADEPRLIHVPVGPMPDPWRFVHMGKVRG